MKIILILQKKIMPDHPKKTKLPPLFIINATIGFRNFLLKTAAGMLPATYVMLEEASKVWKVKAIEIAASLNIAGHLKQQPLSVDQLAGLTGTDADALYRVLRALAGEGIFKELPGRVFKNTRLSLAIAPQKDSVKYFSMHHIGETNWALTGDMTYCVKTGKNAFEHKFNTTPFEHLAVHPDENDIFNKAMTETAELSGSIMADSYPFGKYKTIVDIGGGQGLLLAQILDKHPGPTGILFDQPHVVASAKEHLADNKLQNRCTITEGSFFDALPVTCDLYILKNIIHDWNDQDSQRILKNVHHYMPGGARLLLIETIIKADNKPSFGKFIDLQMLIGTQGGRERTRDEFTALLNDSGFRITKIINNATPFSFIEAVKK
ncbi:MAG TPA: methyltransferase [Bacteroidales bacterium]|nr:methyltransferase [Bacteroidales bacterium]HQN16529.1 methyltransferase [Bacteroidales bacterium]HQP14957.1 methyltransferase [Bacteroidales bacterium]